MDAEAVPQPQQIFSQCEVGLLTVSPRKTTTHGECGDIIPVRDESNPAGEAQGPLTKNTLLPEEAARQGAVAAHPFRVALQQEAQQPGSTRTPLPSLIYSSHGCSGATAAVSHQLSVGSTCDSWEGSASGTDPPQSAQPSLDTADAICLPPEQEVPAMERLSLERAGSRTSGSPGMREPGAPPLLSLKARLEGPQYLGPGHHARHARRPRQQHTQLPSPSIAAACVPRACDMCYMAGAR